MVEHLAGQKAGIEELVAGYRHELAELRAIMAVEEPEDDKAERATRIADLEQLVQSYEAELAAGRYLE